TGNRLSAAVYENDPRKHLQKVHQGLEITKVQYTRVSDDQIRYMVCSTKEGIAFIVIRGTYSVKDMLGNSIVTPVGTESQLSMIQCHKGYATAADSISLLLIERLYQEGFKKIVICGHSAGGGVAHILHLK